MANYVLTGTEIRLVQSWIITKGHIEALKFVLDEMDCTKILPIGRPMQTINSRYTLLQVAFEYILNSAIEENIITDDESFRSWKAMFDKRHDENVAFEKEHGVVQYGGVRAEKKKSTASTKRVAKSIRTTDLITGETIDIPINKPKKETAKERKAKISAAKFSKASFSFSAVNRDNNGD